MTDYDRILLVKPEVFIYRIPPLGTSKGYKAADWKLDAPDFVGRLRLILRGCNVELKIEDKSSGELFAKCPIDKYPGPAIEAVTDSSRYFVLKLVDDSGRSAFIGAGFADRSDSFDLNVALQDHFKHAEKDEKLNIELAREVDKPKLDLGFKEGQTITINLGKKSGNAIGRPKATNPHQGGGFNLPPPPPAGSRITVAGCTTPRSSPALQNPSPVNSNLNQFTTSLNSSASSSPASIHKNIPAPGSSNLFVTSSSNQDTNVGNLLDF